MNWTQSRSGRYRLFTVLYACEGAPIGFIWLALPTLLRSEGVPIERIGGLISVLVLPWALKFLWAPLVDAWRGSRFGLRGWIMSAQLLMGLTLAPLLALDPVAHFEAWGALLFAHALAAATQDVAIDALAIRTTPRAEHGRLNAGMQTGMLLGRGLFGGVGLALAHAAGLPVVLAALIAFIWGSAAILWTVQEPEPDGLERARVRFQEFSRHLRTALRRTRTWCGLAFALTSAAAFEAAGILAGPWLIDRGAAESAIGQFNAVVPTLAPLAGVMAGGYLSDRWGRVRTVAACLGGFVLVILGMTTTDHVSGGASPAWMMGWLTGMYVMIGMFTAGSYAWYMDLTDPKLGGTQYSMFMSATNGCESWSAKVGGRWADAHGYPAALTAMCAVSLASLMFLRDSGNGRESAGEPSSGTPSRIPKR